MASATGSDAVLYLPQESDLRGDIAFQVGVYFLGGFGAFEKADTYPYWFRRGFETYLQRKFSSNSYDAVPEAAADLKAGKAPPLDSIATAADANRLINANAAGAARIDNRGQAAIVLVAEKYGEQAVVDLLQGNASGSISKLNERLQALTHMTLDQFNSALDTWLRQK